jgi:dihydroxyacetone kinase-like predicted kinase
LGSLSQAVQAIGAAGGFKEAAEVYDGSETHQYCTECVIALKDGVGKEEVEARFADPAFGDSLVVVAAAQASTGRTLVKVHIHTGDPDAIFAAMTTEFSDGGVPLKEKVAGV